MNIAAAIAARDGLDTWDGCCLELCNEVETEHPDIDVLWIDQPDALWDFHVVPVIDGVVHDAWNPEAMLPPAEYVAAVFPEARSWELNPGSED